jgi:N12 class adenine-specific DNA methylase
MAWGIAMTGRPRNPVMDGTHDALIAELNGRGMSDVDIAAYISEHFQKVSFATIHTRKRALGLGYADYRRALVAKDSSIKIINQYKTEQGIPVTVYGKGYAHGYGMVRV